MLIHVVEPGETLDTIAAQYGVSAIRLAENNGITNPARLVVGQALCIQYPEIVHTVAAGESLPSVAEEYGVSINQLYRNNPVLRGRPEIRPGQTLVILYDEEIGLPKYTSGYAYPFIDKPLLQSTLPFLSYLIPFTYGFTPQGTLVDLDDAPLIAMAREKGIQSLMHLSTLTPDGSFSNELSTAIFNDAAARSNLIGNIIRNMRQKGYAGLDVDFEYVLPEDREGYVNFARELRQRLHPLGYPLVIALAPKTNADQPGLLYEAHDYRRLGEQADKVLLMTYEWGYTYSEPRAVAPLPNVRQVVEYALTEIPARKIFLGIPNYGYDWPLPYVKGETRARVISNEQAVQIAADAGVSIEYDETAQTPHFQYVNSQGQQHEIWFEDARSIQAKLRLLEEYSLSGAGYWNLMKPFTQNWQVLNSMFQIRQGNVASGMIARPFF